MLPLATLVTAVAWASPAPGPVVLLDPAGSSATARHCLTRIREELVADGFEVSTLDTGPLRDPVAIARIMEEQRGAMAIIALVGAPEKPGGELWILDRVGASPEVRRIAADVDDGDRIPEVLAIRTVEVLKASALKLLLESTRPAPAPPPPAPAAPAPIPAPEARARRFGVEAGIAVIDDLGGPSPAALPVLRARLSFGEALFGRVTLAGLGSRAQVDSSIGSAWVAQAFGLAEIAATFRPGRRWRPVLSAGAGAIYVQTDGTGVWPYQGRRASGWAGVVDGGGGVVARLSGAVSLAVELHALVAFPHPTVRFVDVADSPVSYPALLASLTMVAWL